MKRQCKKCGRAVPVYPGLVNTIIAHVAVKVGTTFEPCEGSNSNPLNGINNIPQMWHLSERLARQHLNLEAASKL